MSCRTGPLRVERPLRGVYTGLAGMIIVGPTVGREMNDPGQRPGRRSPFHPDRLKRRVNARPNAQWARPAGLINRKASAISGGFFP